MAHFNVLRVAAEVVRGNPNPPINLYRMALEAVVGMDNPEISLAETGVLALTGGTGSLVSNTIFATKAIRLNVLQAEPGVYLELFDVDLTKLGGPLLFVTANVMPDGTNVLWRGNTYTAIPVVGSSFEWRSDTQAPPQPVIQFANLGGIIFSYVIQYGDMVGGKVTRWRTFSKYLDNGSNPDPNQYLPVDTWFVEQMTNMQNDTISFKLSSVIDQGVMLPRRLVFSDPIGGNPGFPGVNRTFN